MWKEWPAPRMGPYAAVAHSRPGSVDRGRGCPPFRRAPPSSSCGTRAGAPQSDAPSSQCPSAAAAQSATWTPSAPERVAADRPPGKVTGALDAGPALTGSLLSVSQPSLSPDSWASLPGSPLSKPWVFSPAPGFPGSFLVPLSTGIFLKVAQP